MRPISWRSFRLTAAAGAPGVRGERVKIGDAVQVVEVDPAGITWFAGATQSQSAIHP